VTAAIAASPSKDEITNGVANQLTKSFASAEEVAAQHPQYSGAIVAGAKKSFLDGADWAYTAGIVAILLGATLVFFMFPRKEEETELLARYHAEDTAGREEREETEGEAEAPAGAPPAPAA
jgi:hypothetical protein